MYSVLRKLLERCVPCSRREEVESLNQQTEESMTDIDGLSEDEIHFVIPVTDFPKFEERKPAHGAQLNLEHYMFMYRYITTKENFKRPGPDYEWVMYFFRDRRSIYLLKGWVPTKMSYMTYIKQESDTLKGVKRNVCFQNINQIAKSSSTESASNVIYSDGCFQEKLVSAGKLSPPSGQGYLPLLKSANTSNWGNLYSWSRHVKPEYADGTRRGMETTHTCVHSSASMDQLTRDITAAIEGHPLDKGYARGGDPRGIVKSTIDTRNRRYRPKAAKGPRTRPVMCEKFML